MPERIIRLHDRSIRSLDEIGFAVQHFPVFRNADNTNFHSHDILELNFIVRGTARHRIGDMERACVPGDLGIIHYGQRHCLLTDGEGIEVYNIYLDPANHALPRLPAEFSTVAGALFPPAVMPGVPRGLCSFLSFRDCAQLVALLQFCRDEQESARIGSGTVLESALRIFLVHCARVMLQEGVETVAADSPRWRLLEGVRLKLEREFAAGHTLSELAAEAGVSEAHFCRRFRSYTGLSPFAYLAQCRVRAAMQELRNSDLRIMDIAFNAGFGDIGQFNRKFREFAGCTPGQYRRRQRSRPM